MKKEERRYRIALILLVTVFVFLILVAAIALTVALLYILVRVGVMIDFNQPEADANSLILFMGLISLIIGTVLTGILTVIFMKPINRMINQMNRLASGDFQARLSFGKPIDSHPTFLEISDSFNTMAQELEKTEMLRSDFINNFSHEFKTPIVSIAGFAKLLKRGNLSPEQQLEYLDAIEEESMRLSYMATNVLHLTKVENQTILTDVTRFNLSEQIRSCILLLENEWDKKELDLQLDFGEYMISANEELLKQVWINLLDNAVKFAPRGHTVQVKIREEDGKLQVDILNTGSTIPADKQQRIFQKFYQADESHASKGNGIGLAIVKRIVQLHGGAVSVSSQDDVTCFHATLPTNI